MIVDETVVCSSYGSSVSLRLHQSVRSAFSEHLDAHSMLMQVIRARLMNRVLRMRIFHCDYKCFSTGTRRFYGAQIAT